MIDVVESDKKSAENPDPANDGMILAPGLKVMENSTAERYVYSLHGLTFFPELGSA